MKKILCSLIASTLALTSLMAKPQAVIFDFGGVLTGEPNRESVVSFICKSFGFSAEEFETLNQEKRLAIKQGKTDEEFWLSYAKQNEIDLPPGWADSLSSVMQEAIGVNLDMYALVDELKEKEVRVGLLSNIDARLAKLIRGFSLYEPFEPCLLSCEIGMEKPDPKIYEVLIKELNMPANEIVFIDDKLENVQAAKQAGLDAILFESQPQLRAELETRGVWK